MSSFQTPRREVGARISHNASQSITTATPTILSLNTTRRANGITVGSDRLTALEAGWYVLAAHVAWATNATGMRSVALKLNGATYLGSNHITAFTTPSTLNMSVATVHYLNVNDYVQIEVYQESGGGLNVTTAANYSPELAIMKLPGVP